MKEGYTLMKQRSGSVKLKEYPKDMCVFVVEHDTEASGLEKKKVIPTGG